MAWKVNVGGREYTLTAHAVHRANKRGILHSDIVEAFKDQRWFRRQYSDKGDSYVLVGKNNVRIVINIEQTVIITLMRLTKQYSKNKSKQRKNKRQIKMKKLYGNRYKD